MIPNCERHRWDRSEDECRTCGLAYCASCLVYVHGAHARPMCIQCALKKSGVRGSKRVRPSRRERRQHTRAATAERVATTEVAETEEELAAAGQRAWVSLDASRWDVGAI